MAVYNSAAFLRESIASVLNQTLRDFEFVIVDDGSTDDTPSILSSYHDSRILRIINGHNIGQTESLNRAIHEAISGTYVARVDGDDIAEPNMLQAMVSTLDDRPDLAIVGSAKLFVKSDGSLERVWMPPVDNPAIQQTLLSWNCLPHGGTMYRVQPLTEIGAYSSALAYAQDYDLALKLTERFDAMNLSEPLYRYRWHEGMVSVAKRRKQDEYAEMAIRWAISRRLEWGWALLGWRRGNIPSWPRGKTRRWIAQRFTWWSMGVRGPRRFSTALQFLAISILLDPSCPLTRDYARAVVMRKLKRVMAPRNSLN